MNLLSALFAALAVWVLYAIVRHLTSAVPAVWAATLFAVQAIPWSQAGVAEVNSLNTLLVGLAFLAFVKWSDGEWPVWAVALTSGLAMSHHRTAILLAPLLLGFVIIAWRRGRYTRTSKWGATRAAVLFMLPFAAYAYLPLRAHTTPTYANTWESFANHVTGESALPVIMNTLSRPLGPRFKLVLFQQAFQGPSGWALLLLGALGIIAMLSIAWRLRKPIEGDAKIPRHLPAVRNLPAFWLFVAAFAVSILFATLYDIIDIVDYLAVPIFMWCVPVGMGVAMLFSLLSTGEPGHTARTWPNSLPQAGISLGLLALLLFTVRESLARRDVTVDYSNLDRRAEWSALKQELAAAPPGSIILADWMRFNEAVYFRSVEGWRTDLTPIQVEGFQNGNTAAIDDWLKQNRAVYMLGPYPTILSQYDARRLGPVLQLSGHRSAQSAPLMAHTLDRRFGDKILLLGYTLEPEGQTLRPGTLLRVTFYWKATERIFERFTVFSHIIDGQGGKIGQKDDEPGHGFKPTMTWQPDQVVADTFEITLSPDAQPGEYRLITGMYSSVEGKRLQVFTTDGQPLGDFAELTTITVGK
jgi:hypothetical protein